jgi:phosphomannomutase
MFAETVTKVIASKGLKVYLSNKFSPTPALSMAVKKYSAQMGIMITASHNTFEYNGFKLKSAHGGPMNADDIRDIENLIHYENEVDLDLIKMDNLIQKKLVQVVDINKSYIESIKANFNIELLKKSASKVAVDPMYGSGQNILPSIFPDIQSIHRNWDYSFSNTPPEPLEKNLVEFSKYLKSSGKLKLGICLDGDADRIALMDGKGNYINSHQIILLLIHYLAGYRNQKGIIVTGFSSTSKIEKLAEFYRLPVQRVKIGFKEISQYMLRDDVLVGGEESGGISVKGHIPERDGVWMGLLIWQWMEESGKNINELLEEIYNITGKFAFAREDLKISKDLKSRVMANCNKGVYEQFGPYRVFKTEDLDGYKFFLDTTTWVMIRPSGTEPVLRTYAEADTPEEAKKILDLVKEMIVNS